MGSDQINIRFFSHTRLGFLLFYPCEIYFTYLYQLVGKIKKRTAANCNVEMMSLCRISAYSGFSGSPFHFTI